MPRIEQSIEIASAIDRVYAVARDVESFPEFMADLKSLKVLDRSDDGSRTVTEWVGVIREFKMTIKWSQEDNWDDARHRDDFRMTQGDMDRMEGYWQFTSLASDRTRFDSLVDYDYDVPLIGPLVKSLIKKKMTENLQATMEAIRQRSEAAVAP